MKYVVIDVETTGLFDFKKPADDPSQPHLASLTMIFLDEDLQEAITKNLFIKPEGWTMPEEAGKVNGLTTDFLIKNGESVTDVLAEYQASIEDEYCVAAYGAQFDCKCLRGAMRRVGMDDLFEQTKNVCLMRACTPICKIPGKRGYKWPKLQEACAFFDIPYDAEVPHSSLRDARAAVEILRKLHDLDKLPEPIVHHAKNYPMEGAE